MNLIKFASYHVIPGSYSHHPKQIARPRRFPFLLPGRHLPRFRAGIQAISPAKVGVLVLSFSRVLLDAGRPKHEYRPRSEVVSLEGKTN